jgi:hypothetical protein
MSRTDAQNGLYSILTLPCPVFFYIIHVHIFHVQVNVLVSPTQWTFLVYNDVKRGKTLNAMSNYVFYKIYWLANDLFVLGYPCDVGKVYFPFRKPPSHSMNMKSDIHHACCAGIGSNSVSSIVCSVLFHFRLQVINIVEILKFIHLNFRLIGPMTCSAHTT